MEKIDRLGWAAGIAMVSHGVSIGIRTNEPDALAGLVRRLPPGWKLAGSTRVERLYSLRVGNGPGEGIRRFSLLYQDETRIARALDPTAVQSTLETEMQLYLAERARGRIFVHAGVVAWPGGGAVLIPGRSMSGKSTLVAALVRAGATYYSDEYAVLDARGRVHAYRTPLSLRDGAAGADSELPPAGPGDTNPLPVNLVLITRYRAGAHWRPARLSAGRGGIELLAHTVAARWRPARALSTLARALAGALVLKGVRGEASELVAVVAEHARAPVRGLAH